MFKIRSSAIGKIMGKKGLGKTGQTHCKEWLTEQLYNRRKEFSNKYTEKGLISEDDSIDFVADNLGFGFLVKNEEHFQNDFITGTPDLILPKKTADIKTSWSVFTFPLFNEALDSGYFYQGQGYMNLTGKRTHEVIYVLTDTPLHLIEREARSFCYKNGIEELDQETFDEFKRRMTYSDIDIKLRTKVYSFEYDEAVIKLIQERVVECREYIKTLQQ